MDDFKACIAHLRSQAKLAPYAYDATFWEISLSLQQMLPTYGSRYEIG
jgi:hypothetical protein